MKKLFLILFLSAVRLAQSQEINNPGDPVILNGVAIPLDFPRVDITVNDNPDNGFIFLANINRNLSTYYAMILDNDGAPVWYQRSETEHFDFKKQPNGWLTMHVFDLEDRRNDHFIALDSTYSIVRRYDPPPGYYADSHELLVLPNGNYLMIGGRFETVDMSQKVPGGDPNARIRVNDIFEMDAFDNLVFSWGCLEYLDITDSQHIDLTQSSLDPFHMNSIEIDLDGHLLVSSRHLSQIIKIDRETGQIIWRLGGNQDSFNWIDNPQKISYQHDMRVLPNGNYTLFDNRTTESGHTSRALELQLDLLAWEVFTVWKYNHNYRIQSGGMGNVQRLSNGNTLVNWGDTPYPVLTEVRPDGSRAFEMTFEDENDSYRVLRFPWNGKANKPTLILEASPDRITLIFNKFGDRDVAYYNIYAGSAPAPTEIFSTSELPFAHLSQGLENGSRYYFRITTVDNQGFESAFSNEEDILVKLIQPGENMVQNSDFSNGSTYWSLQSTNGAFASIFITPVEELHVYIQNGTDTDWNVMLYQPDIQLLTGRRYLLEFDAWAETGRALDARIRQVNSPHTNYSKMGLIWLTGRRKHFSYEFMMEESSDHEARLAFLAGASDVDVYLDNVSLKLVVPEQTPLAGFSTDVTTGIRPLDVHFTDRSTGNITSHEWNFGDGTGSYETNPTHVFETTGIYDVSLTVTGPGGSDEHTQSNLITVIEPPPVAAYSSDVAEGFRPLNVRFQDESTGNITSRLWDFGDASTSTEQNPIHLYERSGVFDVTLFVTGQGGTDTLRKEAAITVTEAPPVAQFLATPQKGNRPMAVTFTDSSSGQIDSWLWNFGDSSISVEQHPRHVYQRTDTFSVSLTVTGPGGSDSLLKQDHIIVKEQGPVAEFEANTTQGLFPMTVSFTDLSTGVVDSWEWNFGDDSVSTVQHPIHTYQTADSFSVRLSVQGPGGSDMRIRENFIVVKAPPPVANFYADSTQGNAPLQVNFTDASEGLVTAWLWDFGDGQTSTEQNPVHVYLYADTFTVKLKVFGPGGTDGETRENFIRVEEKSGLIADSEIPDAFELRQNYPNPFHSQTRIQFTLPWDQEVVISIYNLRGSLETVLVRQFLPAGYHSVRWDASGMPAGTYFIRIQAGILTTVKKCVYLR